MSTLRDGFLLLLLFSLIASRSFAQPLQRAEYFYDADPGTGRGFPMPLNSGSTVNQDFTLPIAGLTVGRHVLVIRVCDASGKWSIAESRPFFISTSAAAVTSPINRAEFFYDTDPGIGRGLPLAVTNGNIVNTDFLLASTGLAAGRHALLIRVRDALGKWSIAESRPFFINREISNNADSLVAGEFFVDTDPGTGNGTPLSFSRRAALDSLLRYTAANLPFGQHQFCSRFRSSGGKWSIAECRTIRSCTTYGPEADYQLVRDNNRVSFLNRSNYGTNFNWRVNDADSVVSENYFRTFVSGNYRVLLTAKNSCGRDTLSKGFAIEGIESISPRVIGKTGRSTLTVEGFGFSAGTTIRLIRNGSLLNTDTTSILNAEALETTINAVNIPTGYYRLEVQIPGRNLLVRDSALLVQPVIEPLVQVELQIPSLIRTGRSTLFTIAATNKGNVNAYAVPLMVSGFPLFSSVALLNDTASSANVTIPQTAGMYMGKFLVIDSAAGIKKYPLLIPKISPSETVLIKFNVTGLSTGNFEIFAGSFAPLLSNDSVSARSAIRRRTLRNSMLADGECVLPPPGIPPPGNCGACVEENQSDALFAAAGDVADFALDLLPAKSWVNCAKSTASFALGLVQDNVAKEDCPLKRKTPKENAKTLLSWMDFVASGTKATFDCATALAGASPVVILGKSVAKLINAYDDLQKVKKLITLKEAGGCIAEGISDAFSGNCRTPPCANCGGSQKITFATSWDPNAKTGPGYADSSYIRTSASIGYDIFYENKPTAGLPAQTVFITDTLDKNKYDISSFRFVSASVGKKSVSLFNSPLNAIQDIDLRPTLPFYARVNARLDTARGVVEWQIQTIDTLTLQETTDPLAGFCPPNDAFNNGEGSVSFSINLRNTVQQGDTIKNRASIIFDTNEPILTGFWVNQFDTVAPVSHVLPLADSVFSDRVVVNWSGTDNASGIASYNILVSVNGGPVQSWISGTRTTSDTLKGVYDDVYAFYSQAVDKAGNVEKGKTVPEATIKLKLAPTVFTFNGSGDYRNPANWVGNLLPPDVLPAGSEIIINPAGNSECRMNKPQEVKPGGKFTVLAGKKIRLPGAIEVR